MDDDGDDNNIDYGESDVKQEKQQQTTKLIIIGKETMLLFSDNWRWKRLTFVGLIDDEPSLKLSMKDNPDQFTYFHAFRPHDKLIFYSSKSKSKLLHSTVAPESYIQNLPHFVPDSIWVQIKDMYEQKKAKRIKQKNQRISGKSRVEYESEIKTQNVFDQLDLDD